MSSMSNILLDKEILLESGTNELEVLVFNVADYTFGINVAKVREVLPVADITTLPKAHASVRGVFKLRNQVIPCVSLLDHLGILPNSDISESTMILTDLNKQQTAFLVDEVERIHRLSWENILAVPALDDLASTPVTALARCDERLVVMLDFEMILDDVTDQLFRTDEVANPMGLPREKLRILLAEDSPTVRQAIGATLSASGYQNVTVFENGAEAWNWISQRIEETGQVEDVGDLLICDVEMPQVDGLHLTKQIKEHSLLRQIPVLLYSSIITPDNYKKGKAVGADAQVAKPELAKVVQLADELIVAAQRDGRASALKEITDAADTPNAEAVAGERSAEAAPVKKQASSEKPPTPETTSSAAGPLVDQCEPEPPTVPAAELLSNDVSPQPGSESTGRTSTEPEEPADHGQSELPSEVNTTSAESPAEEIPDLDNEDVTTSPPPRNVDASLWRTFHRELTERTQTLEGLLRQVSSEERSDELARQMARVLHTIKSASMVVPVDPATRCTHLAESLLEKWRTGGRSSLQDTLGTYVGWLRALVSEPEQADSILQRASALEVEMNVSLQGK
jgi:two-component system, chemotaxis family, chemotaxis protein CheV